MGEQNSTILAAGIPDALPERLEDGVEGLNTVGGGCFSKRGNGKGSDGPGEEALF